MRRAAVRLGVAALCVVTPLAAQGPLDRLVSLTVREAPLPEALMRLKREQRAPLAWRGDQIPPLTRVTIDARDARLGDVLRQLLQHTLLTPRVTSSGTVLLVAGSAASDTLATGLQLLDQLVITGSALSPTAGREQPTAVSVISGDELAASPHHRLSDALRAFVPGLVLWDHGGIGPPPVVAGVRGVASFTSRAPKTYIDGVEVASAELFTLLDLRAVDQVEMIHGPQGAALYGPEAIAGVIQIETRKGRVGESTIEGTAEVLGGGIARDGSGTAPWTEAAAAASVGGAGASAHVVGSWTRIGSADPVTQAWDAQAGGRWAADPLNVGWSARVAEHDAPLERVAANGATVSARSVEPLREHGASVRVRHVVSERLSHGVTLGTHRIAGTREAFRSPILPPTLPLGATNETATRHTLRWAASLDLSRLEVSGGAEMSRRELTRSARQAGGTADLSALYDEALDARGAFAQLRLRSGGLVVSAGARADRISSLGAEAATPWAATLGATWTTAVGLHTVRVRGAWGRALRPPEPGMSATLTSGSIAQQSNPKLSAEAQSGYELGVEWHTTGGAWLRFTWFDQRAEELIQQVDLRRTVDARRQYQFQNVGAITNRGAEVDGGLRWRDFSAAGRLNLVRSRVAELSPSYSGEFEPGDAPLEVPSSMGSIAIRHERGRTRVEVGATWLGPWTGYDWRLIQRVEAGQAPVRERVREYWLEYDGLLRPFVGAAVQLSPAFRASARLEWPASDSPVLRDNLTPGVGRTLILGLRLTR